jgi:hypothetical protein
MLVSYEVIEVQPARGRDAIYAGLADIALNDLPVLAMENTGATLEEALTFLDPMLKDLAFTRKAGSGVFPFNIYDDKKDRGIHVDSLPVSPQQTEITCNIHHTEKGVAQGDFLRYQPAFLRDPFAVWRARGSNQSNWFGGEDEINELFAQGLVDDAYFIPTCHRATLPAGTSVVFKEGLPLAHGFTSLERPRYSRAQLFNMPIERGFNITQCQISPTYL